MLPSEPAAATREGHLTIRKADALWPGGLGEGAGAFSMVFADAGILLVAALA